MADKKIKIHLFSSADLAAFRDANTALVQMARSAGTTNKEMSAAALRAQGAFTKVGNEADKAAARAVRSAKEIEEAWKQAYKPIGDPQPLDSAANGFGRLGQVAKGVAKGIGGAFNSVFTMIAQGGVWGAMSLAVTKGWEIISKKIDEAREAVEKLKVERLAKEMKDVESSAAAVAASFDKGTAAIDKQLKKQNELLAVQKKLVDAAIELQKQQELTAASGNPDAQAIIERKFATRKAEADFIGDDEAVRNRYDAARGWVEADDKYLDDMSKWLADVDRRLESNRKKAAEIEERANKAAAHGSVNSAAEYLDPGSRYGEGRDYAKIKKQIEELSSARAKGEENVAKARARRKENIEKMDVAAKELKELEDINEARRIADERYAAERESAIDKAEDAEIEAAQREADARAAAELKAAEQRAAAEAKAAQEAAKERDRLDRELHAKRMDDLRAEIAAQKDAATQRQGVASYAQTEFDRAFAMYRDPTRAASEIAEERDRAADLKQLHRDASRYGGKWRIDELSQLMSAGDTQGVQSRLEDWRKSRSFTPEVEAMVRASAAEQTKTTAEDELRKLNDKTGELAQKLEQLAQSRDGKLDGIERNTSQLANKIDELLTVKG